MEKLCFVPVALVVGYVCFVAYWCRKDLIQLFPRCARVNLAGGGSDIEFVAIEEPLAMKNRHHGGLWDKEVEESRWVEGEMKMESLIA